MPKNISGNKFNIKSTTILSFDTIGLDPRERPSLVNALNYDYYPYTKYIKGEILILNYVKSFSFTFNNDTLYFNKNASTPYKVKHLIKLK